jgi:hypothetical protein
MCAKSLRRRCCYYITCLNYIQNFINETTQTLNVPKNTFNNTFSTGKESITMENAANAVNKLFAKDPTPDQPESEKVTSAGDVNETVDSKVAPAVEHTHVKKQHETREQTFIEKEKHQDHYHTTIQPLKDSEILPEKHDHTQETVHRSTNNDDGTAEAQANADRAGFESTSEEKRFESKTQEPAQVEEHVHHHLHETVQPVIEKGESNTDNKQVLVTLLSFLW